MKMKTALISIVVCIIPISLFSAEYSLQDVFNAALQNSEKIQYSMENLNIARIGKSKSLSVLMPRIVGYGTYVEYSKRQYDDYGYLTQPDSAGQWGIRADETLSLGLREFTALSMADTGIKKSSLDLDNTKEEFLLQVARAYFDTLKAEKQVEIARANLERLNKYKDMAEKRLKVGEITKTVLLRAQGELSGAQSDMVNAENAVNLIRAVLVRLTGIETDFKIKDQPVQDKELEGLQVLKDSAYENRSDLKSLEYMKKLALQQKSYAIGSYFPNITLSALYQRTDQSPGDINKVPETASVAAGFNFPLFVGGYRKADVDEAKAKYRQAELLYEDLKKNVSVEVETAWLEVNTQKQVIVFLTDQVSFARNNFFSITRQFEMGLASSIDVLDANTLLLTSERKLANELYALQIAQLRLKRSTGTLLRDSN
ncbi:MAG TPA: TolC family protein [Desulfomonilia bacterium]